MIQIKAMIDYGWTWNLILQLFISEHSIPQDKKIFLGFQTISKKLFNIYGSNEIYLSVHNKSKEAKTLKQNFLKIDIAGLYQMILGLLWFKATQPMIN